MGYMVFENGIFLFSLTLLKEMPLIVNLGVLLELFMIIFVSGFFVTKIKESYNDDNIDNLTDLRD
jgi:hydrogenase-4 component E